MRLEPFDVERDLDAAVALQNRVSGANRQWSRSEAEMLLLDPGRRGGANVVVARHDDELVGLVGWVHLGEGEFYGSPLVSVDQRGVVDALALHVVGLARAQKAEWIRVSGWPDEHTKANVLNALGFLPVFEFVEFDLVVAPTASAPSLPPGVRVVDALSVDYARYATLYNDCFAKVDNTPPVTPELARDTWTARSVWPEASFVWTDDAGEYRSFCLCHEEGVVELVGVHAAWRRRGTARAMMAYVTAAASAEDVTRLRSICATTNAESMTLHESLGFVETARRTVWQLDL